MHALGQYLSHAELLQGMAGREVPLPKRPRAAKPAAMLDEAASLALLASRGVPVARHVLCTSAALDSTGSLFLRVPDGWVGEGDVVRVSAVPPSTSSPLPFT